MKTLIPGNLYKSTSAKDLFDNPRLTSVSDFYLQKDVPFMVLEIQDLENHILSQANDFFVAKIMQNNAIGWVILEKEFAEQNWEMWKI